MSFSIFKQSLTLLCLISLPAVGSTLTAESSGTDAGPQLSSPGEGFQVTELGSDAVVVTSEPFAANSLLVRTLSGEVILVDSPATPADTQALLAWAEEHWRGPVTHAVTSHWHLDASGGNQVLLAAGVEVISSKLTALLLRDRGETMKAELIRMFQESDPETATELEAFQPTAAPNPLEISGSRTIELGGELIILLAPGPSHSPDSIGVYFPRLRMLYGGCAVRSNGRIANPADADLATWEKALETFADLGAEIVVPGHGLRFDPAMIQESIEAVQELQITKTE